MRRLLSSGRTSAVALGAIALVIAFGAGAYAAPSGKTITVCVQKKSGALYKAKKCKKGASKLSWNEVGPQGPKGDTGVQGIQGIQGQQGPGATSLFDEAQNDETSSVQLTTVGPFTLYEQCTSPATGETQEVFDVSATAGTSWDALGTVTDNVGRASTGSTVSETWDGSGTTRVPVLTVDAAGGVLWLMSADLTLFEGSGGPTYYIPVNLIANSANGTCDVAGSAVPTS